MFERLEYLIPLAKLTDLNVLLIGLGGVGGYALECLIRSGIKNITVVDYDVFELSNLNRQILANINNIGEKKVEEAKKHAKSILKNVNITALDEKLTPFNIEELLKNNYDYIIDACDDIKVKTKLIILAHEKKLNLISCMGTANKLNPHLFEITTLNKTYNDPIAKKLRANLDKKYHKVKVVWSSELSKKQKELGTICPIPMIAGAYLASYVINDAIKKS